MNRGILSPGMRLRAPESHDDHAWLVELHNDPLVLHNLTDPRPITMASHMAWWSDVRTRQSERRLIFEVDGERVGFTKFYSIDVANRCCTLGADIHVTHRGRGLGKPMWTMMLDTCFGPALQLHRVGLTTAEYNLVGQRLYRGLGFKDEGRAIASLFRSGEFYDQLCMYMLSSDWEVE